MQLSGDMMAAYTYIVECTDGSLYTGFSTDWRARIAAHNAGKGAKYTRSRRPVRPVYLQEFASKSAAMKREAAIKKLTRAQKLKLISNAMPPNPKCKARPRCGCIVQGRESDCQRLAT